MAKHAQYSDQDKAAALAALTANGNNLKRTAREAHIPVSTLKRWRDGQINHGVAELRPQKTVDLKALLSREIDAIFKAMPKARRDASYRDLGTVAGILFDKKQLLEGKPTQINDDASLTDETRAARLMELLDAARARRDGRTNPGESGQ